MTHAVAVTHVSKRILDGSAPRLLLEDVSFHVDRGELVVLRGPSGSGKTTLLALVGAMASPTSGEVALDGEATSRLRDAHRAEVRRRKVGFVFQDLQLLVDLSARDNVLLARVPVGVSAADEARADALLEKLGLASVAHRVVRLLSGGEKQRVAIARALLADPPVLVLDEPTAHLDDARARAIADELAALAAEGRAVLVGTHDSRLADHPAVSRVLELTHGRLVAPEEGP